MADINETKKYTVQENYAFMLADQKYKAGDEISLNDIQAVNLIACGFIKGASAEAAKTAG